MKKKTFIIALCLALVVAFAAGGAIAWLTATTGTVTTMTMRPIFRTATRSSMAIT